MEHLPSKHVTSDRADIERTRTTQPPRKGVERDRSKEMVDDHGRHLTDPKRDPNRHDARIVYADRWGNRSQIWVSPIRAGRGREVERLIQAGGTVLEDWRNDEWWALFERAQ